MIPELHRPLAVDHIGADGLERIVEANAAERAALAERLLLPAVVSLWCRFRLRRIDGGVIAAEGSLRARVVQTCVVSLDDFEAGVREDFTVRFVPSGTEQDDIDPGAEDEIPYEHGGIDLGEAATEQLALALDPWPRRPGATVPEAAAEEAPHPFAGLARLKRGLHDG
jgi:uncharacterized metal-binding protein YceD (DUF177 family)